MHETADALAANLRIAHADAIDKDEDVDFTVQGDGHGYELERRRGASHTGGGCICGCRRDRKIRFFADGSTSSGGVITLAEGLASRFDISVDIATGAVTADGHDAQAIAVRCSLNR